MSKSKSSNSKLIGKYPPIFLAIIFSFLKNLQIDKELEINSVKIYHVANLNNQELINLIQEKKIEIRG